jgi:1-acyl-sn-glycerol-3-phosphate acyltransferase
MNNLRGFVAATLLAVNTALWCAPLFCAGLVRLLLPFPAAQRYLSGRMDLVINGWVACNRITNAVLRLHRTDLSWQVEKPLSLDKKYLVISNHQSWGDILILQNTLNGIVPPLKFFTKKELIYLPLLGIAMWLLGFPYVRRQGAGDRSTLSESCRGFKQHPVSILNFLEGTRFTAAKHAATASPYKHLLPPKTGGLAFVLGELGAQIDQVLDVTIVYPEGTPTFWQFLCGDCRRSRVDISGMPVPVASADQDLTELEVNELKAWAHDRWIAKDAQLDALIIS